MAQLRPKIVKLAKVIGGVSGMVVKIDENAPEYYCMANIVSDDEADIAIAAGLRKERTAEYLAKKVGKTVEEIKPLLDNLVYYGIFRRTLDEKLGEDVYFMQIFAPGILEMMVNNKELMAAHPEVGRAFEEYTRVRMQLLGPVLPNGYGLMRVIPVESAIKDIPGVSDYEKLSYYLNKYDTFSVSPCSCRASRTSIGDGCGHLDEDMCVQMGKGAEHYIRSGRARRITREEAMEIILRAEENGLMHDIPNIEEAGDSAAICNCCSCACFGLRAGLMFGARDAIRSNFVAEIDEAKCVACAQCVETCPGNALKLGQKLCSSEDLTPPGYAKLTNTVFVKKTFNPDYRENFKDTLDTGTAPCKAACPAHVPVQGYLKLAAQGRYTDALELIKKENPFPAICGRVCPKFCEDACTRGDIDDPIAIDDIKKFIAEQDMKAEHRFVPKMVNQIGTMYPQKIAVIGAGPAGLSCAYYLAVKGYPVTVFEKENTLGGMMTMGIPTFRLEKDVVMSEIEVLKELGVEFKTGIEVGKDISLNELRVQGYKAFYMAIGAQKSAPIGIPGEKLDGVYGGIDFLRSTLTGKPVKLGERVAVIGGGNVSVDVARSAIRLGAKEVTLIYRRGRDELKADPDEVEDALNEGVKLHLLASPVEIIGKDGAVTALKLEKMKLGAPDASGRRSPVSTGEFETMDVDNVIGAIGQIIDWGGIEKGSMQLDRKGCVKVNELSYQTGEPDVFAGGDVVTGPAFVIHAIAAGKEGAISIHRYVHPGQTQNLGRDRRIFTSLDKTKAALAIGGYDTAPRQKAADAGADKARKTMDDLRGTFTEEQMKKETERCLGCGAVVLDEYRCVGCGICTTKCKFDAIKLVWVDEFISPKVEKIAPHLIAGMAKRGSKIAIKALKDKVAKL